MIGVNESEKLSELVLGVGEGKITNDLHLVAKWSDALATDVVSQEGTPRTHLVGLIIMPQSLRCWKTSRRWCLCSSVLVLAMRRSSMYA